MFLAGIIIQLASEFPQVIKLSTVTTLFEVSIEYVEDCSGDKNDAIYL